MITQYDIDDGYVKSLILRLNPIEGLVLHSALMQYADDSENNEKDRMMAINMLDSYIRAMNLGGGNDETDRSRCITKRSGGDDKQTVE